MESEGPTQETLIEVTKEQTEEFIITCVDALTQSARTTSKTFQQIHHLKSSLALFVPKICLTQGQETTIAIQGPLSVRVSAVILNTTSA